jgi:adenylate cyclase
MNKKELLHSSIIGISIAVFFSLLFLQRIFMLWQLRLSDTLFLPGQSSPEVVIIGIDDKSIEAIGRWPWDRDVHAKLLNILGTRPAVIGYDVSFPEPSNASDDAALATAISHASPTVLPIEARAIYITGENIITSDLLQSIPEIREQAIGGLVNTIADEDSVTRSVPILVQSSTGQAQEHFAYIIARLYQEAVGEELIERKDIVTDQGMMKINYVGQPGTFTTYSFSDVIDGTIPPETFEGKIVLVGAVAPNLRDAQITPVSFGLPMNGVEINANVINTLLSRTFLKTEQSWVTVATIFVLSIGTTIILSLVGILFGAIIVILTVIGYLIYTFVWFDMGVIRNVLFPILSLLSAYLATTIYKYFNEFNQQRFLRKAFAYYVSPSVLNEIIKRPEQLILGGQQRVMTVLFSDIKGFTSISEDMSPEEVSKMLNYYLNRVSRQIFKYNGVIDKFVGDGVLAFWNAPLTDEEHAMNACRAAIGITYEVRMVQDEMKKMGVEHFNARIGINTGEMIVGNMGSDMRFNYTVLGDNVNLGSRLEGINKQYDTSVMIAESTYQAVKGRVVARRIDTVVVKGKKKGVNIYELLGIGNPTGEEADLIEQFEAARQLYEKGEFKKAYVQFERLAGMFPDDGPTKVYLRRCHEFVDKPPSHWDGIYRPTNK